MTLGQLCGTQQKYSLKNRRIRIAFKCFVNTEICSTPPQNRNFYVHFFQNGPFLKNKWRLIFWLPLNRNEL